MTPEEQTANTRRIVEQIGNVASVNPEEAADTVATHLRVANLILASSAKSDEEYTKSLMEMFNTLQKDGRAFRLARATGQIKPIKL